MWSMMKKNLSLKPESEKLKQLSTEQLIEIIIEQATVIGQLKARIDEGFEHHALFRQTQNLDEFLSWACGFKLKVESAIDSWFDRAGGEAGKLLRSLRKKAEQWWYFLDHPDIPPDNNLAERTLRLAVTKRKVSGGSRSMERFQDTGNLLTVIQTCRRQKRSVIEFFDQAIKAMVNPAVQTPSLIPLVQT